MATYSNAITQTGINTEISATAFVQTTAYTVSSSNGYAVVFPVFSSVSTALYIKIQSYNGQTSTWFDSFPQIEFSPVGAGPYYFNYAASNMAAHASIGRMWSGSNSVSFTDSSLGSRPFGFLLMPGERLVFTLNATGYVGFKGFEAYA